MSALKVRETGDSLVVDWWWGSGYRIVFVPLLCLFAGILIVGQSELPGWAVVLMRVFGGLLAYLGAAVLLNRTRLSIAGGVLTYGAGPIPMIGKLRINLTDVASFDLVAKEYDDDERGMPNVQLSLHYTMTSGTQHYFNASALLPDELAELHALLAKHLHLQGA